MTTQQGLRQAAVRSLTGTTYSYNGDWMALFDFIDIPPHSGGPRDFNGRMLLYINTRLGTSYTNLSAAMQAMATAEGVYNFEAIGTFTASLSKIYPRAGSYSLTGSAVTLRSASGFA